MMNPIWKDDEPLCSEEECPQYDGKNCNITGERVETICRPEVRNLHQHWNSLGDTIIRLAEQLRAHK